MTKINPQAVRDLLVLIQDVSVLIVQLPLFYRATGVSFAPQLYARANALIKPMLASLVRVASVFRIAGVKPTINTQFVNRKTWSDNFLSILSRLPGIANALGEKPAEIIKARNQIIAWYNQNIAPWIGSAK